MCFKAHQSTLTAFVNIDQTHTHTHLSRKPPLTSPPSSLAWIWFSRQNCSSSRLLERGSRCVCSTWGLICDRERWVNQGKNGNLQSRYIPISPKARTAPLEYKPPSPPPPLTPPTHKPLNPPTPLTTEAPISSFISPRLKLLTPIARTAPLEYRLSNARQLSFQRLGFVLCSVE